MESASRSSTKLGVYSSFKNGINSDQVDCSPKRNQRQWEQYNILRRILSRRKTSIERWTEPWDSEMASQRWSGGIGVIGGRLQSLRYRFFEGSQMDSGRSRAGGKCVGRKYPQQGRPGGYDCRAYGGLLPRLDQICDRDWIARGHAGFMLAQHLGRGDWRKACWPART